MVQYLVRLLARGDAEMAKTTTIVPTLHFLYVHANDARRFLAYLFAHCYPNDTYIPPVACTACRSHHQATCSISFILNLEPHQSTPPTRPVAPLFTLRHLHT